MIRAKENYLEKNKFIKLGIYLIQSTILLLILILFSGCAGMIVDSIVKSTSTDDTYEKMEQNFQPLEDGKGRLFVYRTEASTKTHLTYGVGLSKNVVLFSINDNAYDILWKSFRYFDLSFGQYEITYNVIMKKKGWTGFEYHKGINKNIISIANGSKIFLRVDLIKGKLLKFTLVDSEQALKEIFNLPYQNRCVVIRDDKIEWSDQ